MDPASPESFDVLGEVCSLAYLQDEFHRFRKILCSTKFKRDQKELAFKGLSTVYFSIQPKNDQENNQAINLYNLAVREFQLRMAHEP